jgi:hypothetical protein
MENKNENSDASKTYEERQREARRRYYEKIKDTEEYKQKNRDKQRKFMEKDKEKYNEYQREYQRNVYYPKVKNGERKNKYLENEVNVLLPMLIKTN